jgi:hypothetical protein
MLIIRIVIIIHTHRMTIVITIHPHRMTIAITIIIINLHHLLKQDV